MSYSAKECLIDIGFVYGWLLDADLPDDWGMFESALDAITRIQEYATIGALTEPGPRPDDYARFLLDTGLLRGLLFRHAIPAAAHESLDRVIGFATKNEDFPCRLLNGEAHAEPQNQMLTKPQRDEIERESFDGNESYDALAARIGASNPAVIRHWFNMGIIERADLEAMLAEEAAKAASRESAPAHATAPEPGPEPASATPAAPAAVPTSAPASELPAPAAPAPDPAPVEEPKPMSAPQRAEKPPEPVAVRVLAPPKPSNGYYLGQIAERIIAGEDPAALAKNPFGRAPEPSRPPEKVQVVQEQPGSAGDAGSPAAEPPGDDGDPEVVVPPVPKGTPYTEEERARLLALHDAGKTFPEIARLMGRTTGSVSGQWYLLNQKREKERAESGKWQDGVPDQEPVLSDSGQQETAISAYEPTPREEYEWADDNRQCLVDRRYEGKSFEEIGRELGRTAAACRSMHALLMKKGWEPTTSPAPAEQSALTADDIPEVQSMLDRDCSDEEMCEWFGCQPDDLHRFCQKHRLVPAHKLKQAQEAVAEREAKGYPVAGPKAEPEPKAESPRLSNDGQVMTDQYIGRREDSTLRESDWGDIAAMLKAGRTRQAIAWDYDVTTQELDGFIAAHEGRERQDARSDLGEARAPL